MESVVVGGVGIHPFGRFDGVTTTDLGVAAVKAALGEAGIGKGGFQAAFCATAYGGVASGHKILSRLGMTGMPIVDIEAGCASGGAALSLAGNAIRSGQIDTALVFGIEKMPRGIIRSSFFEPWQEAAGLAATPAYFALRAQRLMQTSGVTKQHLAQVVVKNRKNGVMNPDAMFRSEVDLESVLASRVVCEPLHLWMLCSPNEGAAAVVITRSATGGGGGRGGGGGASGAGNAARPVRLAAAVLRSHLPGAVLSESTPMSGLAKDDVTPPTSLAAEAAYEEAGIGPEDADLVECQDTDAARELLSYEELGLCTPGGSAGLLESGATSLGGRLPVNVSGGLLSKGEPLGASALGQVVELVRQLQGRAGPRQVPNARVAIAHTVGRGANASVVVSQSLNARIRRLNCRILGPERLHPGREERARRRYWGDGSKRPRRGTRRPGPVAHEGGKGRRPRSRGTDLPGLEPARPDHAHRAGASLGDRLRHRGPDRTVDRRGGEGPFLETPTDERIVEWFSNGHAALCDALRSAPGDLACWSFLPAPSPLAFWARRQAHETAIHRGDAEQCFAALTPFEPGFAADGVDELLTGFAARGRKLLSNPPRTMVVEATDTRDRWLVILGNEQVTAQRVPGSVSGPAAVDCTVRGTAPDLYLALWNRLHTSILETEGDRSVLDGFCERLQIRWT